MFTMTRTENRELINQRGPRYCVSADITGHRGNHGHVLYAETAEKAEEMREKWDDEGGYQNIKVHLPDIAGFDINLAGYGRARKEALAKAAEATEILKAAVQRAADVGRAEAEIARAAEVDRMTVRAWLGK